MAQHRLRIIICGAGIAGLCAGIGLAKGGHNVTILESAHKLSPVGGGLHVPPNATLVLKHWGILDRFESIAIVPAGFTFRRYVDSKILGQTPASDNENKEESPYWSLKRSDYQQILYEVAKELGVEIRLGCRVESIDQALPAVVLRGEKSTADLIVIADGMKSKLRQQILPDDDFSPVLQPYETYRAWAPSSIFANDQATKSLFAEPAANIWMGPNRHIIIYPAENGKILAVNGTHTARNNSTAAEWNKPASVETLQHSFRDFDPVVLRILSEVRDCKAWALAEIPRLPRWTSMSGNVVLIGDAAHGMLQFLAQGAAMAVEDAAALTECVNRVGEDIPKALQVFERSRKWRCERVQAQARRNGEFIHMPDGEEQEYRDRKLGEEVREGNEEVDLGPFFDEGFKRWLYGLDVFEQTRKLIDAAGF